MMFSRPARCFAGAFLAAVVVTATMTACSRAPRTAYEARERLPRAFAGKVSEGGNGPVRTVRLPTDTLKVRDEHTLEFESVRFLVLNPVNDDILMDETVRMPGIITIPGGEVRLEGEGAEGMRSSLKAANFVGKLADDCQSAEASWRMDGQEMTLRLKAVK